MVDAIHVMRKSNLTAERKEIKAVGNLVLKPSSLPMERAP
jgi:hypothetical protein